MRFRRLFTGARGRLPALCALIAVIWAASYHSLLHIGLPVTAGSTRWDLRIYRGVLSVSVIEDFPRSLAGRLASVQTDDTVTDSAWDERYWRDSLVGLSVEDAQLWLPDMNNQRVARRWCALNLPLWLIFSVAALPPAHALFIALCAYRRSTHGLCGVCGYELGGGHVCQACVARAALIGATPRTHLQPPAT